MPTILVVDDDSVDREAARRCLSPMRQLEIDNAENGEEALARMAERAPDLVLTDLRMPGMDGLELVARARESFPLIPVVLMTSKGNEQIAVKALKAGAASYVPKAELKESLEETIEQVLELARAGRSRNKVLGYLDHRESRFELINDTTLISPLAAYFQDSLERIGFGDDAVRSQVGMALMEALSNAMIHGNLEVGSELRRHNKDEYYRMIDRRRDESPFRERRVRCTAREMPGRIEYVIADEGPGFDITAIPDPTEPENIVHVSGRGILLMRTFMDTVEFNGKGNRITMTRSGIPSGSGG